MTVLEAEPDQCSAAKKENQGNFTDPETGTKCLTLYEALQQKIPEEEKEILPPIFVKAHQQLLKLYELIDEGTDEVTKSRILSIQREVNLLKGRECERYELDANLANLEKKAFEEFLKLDERWDEIVLLTDPMEITTQVAAHKEKCNELLEEKKKTIANLKEILKKKDEEFINELAVQGGEVHKLLDKIEEQIIRAREAFKKELESLEEFIDEEKKALIETNRNKWDNLLKQKGLVDKAFIEKIMNIIESYQQPKLLAEKKNLEHKRLMRSKLDKFVNDLIIQTDFVRTICILNLEKLTYNKQLLFYKALDNKMIKETCRKYNTRMGNHLVEAKKNLEEKKANILKQMDLYAQKMDKLNKTLLACDKRCDDLAQSHSKNYFELWNFVDKEVETLIKEICACDKIIYEECLLIPWTRPKCSVPKPFSYYAALKFSFDSKRKVNFVPKPLPKIEPNDMKKICRLVTDGLKYSLINENNTSVPQNLILKDQKLLELNSSFEVLGVTTDEQIKSMMKYFLPYVVCPECESAQTQPLLGVNRISRVHMTSFDLCNVTHEGGSNGEDDSHSSVSENIPNYTDITKEKFAIVKKVVEKETSFLEREEEYEWKMDQFRVVPFGEYPEPDEPIESDLAKLDGSDCDPPVKDTPPKSREARYKPICAEPSHHPYVNPLKITQALEDFTNDVYKNKTVETGLNVEEILLKERKSPSRMMIPEEVTKYWESYLQIFSPQKIALWKTMTYILQDYHRALQNRYNLNVEIQKHRLINYELRKLLESYSPNKRI